MNVNRKSILALVIATLTSLVGITSTSYADNSSWIPNPGQDVTDVAGYHQMIFEDTSPLFQNFSVLQAYKKDGMYLCKSTSDSACKGNEGFKYNSILKVCQSATDVNCIISIDAMDQTGADTPATFDSYTVTDFANAYPADPKLGIPAGDTPSIWNIPSAAHASGTQYAALVGMAGSVGTNADGSILAASLIPVSLATYNDGSQGGYQAHPYDYCTEVQQAPGQMNIGCNHLHGESCLLTTNNVDDCYSPEDFPSGFTYSMKLRLAKEPTGWLHGRMENPNISITHEPSGAVDLTVTAGTTSVPEVFQAEQWSKLSPALQQFWVDCMHNGDVCGPVSTHGQDMNYYSESTTLAGNAKANLEGTIFSFGKVPMEGMTAVAPLIGNKSSAMTTAWSFRTLSNEEMSGSDKCFTSTPGIKGIVTTNSTTYSAGPPVFKDGALNYQVASAHYLPDGSTPFKGVYNLVMRSDTARCIYGFSSAPITASISVLSADGANDVATTVAGEKNGWLSLSANNFQFSSPTIKVKLTQAGSSGKKAVAPAPKPTKAPAKKK